MRIEYNLRKIRLAIVVAEFNQEITNKMLNTARNHAKNLNIHVEKIIQVPGTFDMPLIVEKLLQIKQIDAVVTLGAVIKGETGHDAVIANNTARLLSDISLKYQKPVTLGITGPDMTVRQAKNRVIVVPKLAVEAARKMVTRLRELDNIKGKV
ncbi:MAG TPA: 6,7-dimethyl-8-ribityllumazine synthase [Nitrososphaeraceae archaeon]|nr:6,7-dimethyl-8-ribityllumazine synthase [Nitrososphaeraceae archaeon]